MDIERARMIGSDLVKHYTDGYKFKFDKARRRFGQCQITAKIITLSEPLTVLNSEERFLNTVLHEIAHALTPLEQSHGKIWKAKAISIGCDGNRCYSSAEVIGVPKAYVGECPGCQRQVTRHRPRKTVSCGLCSGGAFNPDYVFVWTKIV